jgi:NAD(P)-dependent dehydrogenase (short-subunit alcohol dehydrogenase family)
MSTHDQTTYQPQAPFADANALIYGAAKGIGRAVALEFARRGAKVAVADIDDAAARDTAAEIIAAGGEAIARATDVLSEESVRATAESAESAFGAIDIVMNNVGGMLNGNPEDIPFYEWERIMNLNYFAAVRGVQLFLPKMLARGRGHIVNTASFAGFYPFAASRIPYVAAKAAVIAMTESLAIYLQPQGVHVSCLIPGPVMTDVLDSMTSWTPDCPMRGPGSELELKLVDEVADTLANGMRDGRVLIPSDRKVWDIIQRWAASPDAFIQSKIDEFASGNSGRPIVPEALRRQLEQQGRL